MSKITMSNYMVSQSLRRSAGLMAIKALVFSGMAFEVNARDYFNPELLEIDKQHQRVSDLSFFEEGGSQEPGKYRVDIYINDEFKTTQDIEFYLDKGEGIKNNLQPCLSTTQLDEMGVKTQLFSGLSQKNSRCANIASIPSASAEFRFSSQRLLLSIPQSALSQQARDYIPEERWDNGINALLLNYSLSGDNTYSRRNDSQSRYANLRPGINIGAWRLRNYTTWVSDNKGKAQWDTIYTYLARDVVSLKSQMLIGDSSSSSDVFDSVPFRGLQMASDDDMLPDSLKGYAPVVRGIARTNAQVVIRQNGYIVYQSYVAPGAFEIRDMYPTGGSGDLYVTVKEANGSEEKFVVPFASLPLLQREGRFKYAVTGGQYRTYDSRVEKNSFSQGSAVYGLPKGFTVYGGMQFSRHYQSGALGLGKNLGTWGAVSSDVTHAASTLQNGEKDTGQSWRIRYSKNIIETGTNFTIAGYRYTTDGYYNLQEVFDTYRGSDQYSPLYDRKRARNELTMNQVLGDENGALSLSWISETYWDTNRTQRSIGVGYNNSWRNINYGLSYSYNINSGVINDAAGNVNHVYDRDQIFSLNLSIPLSLWGSNTYASYNLSSSQHGGTTNNVGLNGALLDDNNLTWAVQEGYDSNSMSSSAGVNTDYKGTYSELNAGYAYDKHTRRLNYGMQGAIVLHEDGITFGMPLSETGVLVKAPGASGVGVSNQTGIKTDWRGYAIVPYATPYHKNPVLLNTTTLPDNVELALSTQTVIPTRGALARANFEANIGQRVLMTLLRPGVQQVPFGATVSDESKIHNPRGFMVGEGSQVYLTGLSDTGTLHAKWGEGAGQHCFVRYTLTHQKIDSSGIKIVHAKCV